MSQQLPALNSYGVFTVLPPFTIGTVNYRCTSLQLIEALVETGVNVFTTYYSPFGISNVQYQLDIANKAAIVTLESNDGPTLILPSSFVDTMPVELAVPYSRMVLSIDLGELPDTLSLTQLTQDVQVIANNYVGVTSVPKLHKIKSLKNHSYAESQIKEAQRLLAVQQYQSFYKGKVDSDQRLAAALQKITMLEAALIAANHQIALLTPPPP